GIQRWRLPHRPAAEPPGIAAGRPRVAAELARGWDGEEAPDHLARVRIVGGDVAADFVLGARYAYEHHVVPEQGRHGRGVPGTRIVDLDLPEEVAAALVECHQTRIELSHVHLVLSDRDTAIDLPTAQRQGGNVAEHRYISPDLLAGPGVDGVDLTL